MEMIGFRPMAETLTFSGSFTLVSFQSVTASAYENTKTGVAYTVEKTVDGTKYIADKTKQGYLFTKDKALDVRDSAKTRVALPIAAHLKNTGKALGIAPDLKTKTQVLIGVLNSIVSFDMLDVQRPYSFAGQRYAVITINGMDNNSVDAGLMRDMVFGKYKVTNGASIANGKGPIPLVFDILQSVGYELFGAVDAPVINAALAMKEGIKEKTDVYVIAHSQGSEVFMEALKLLSPEERSHVHYQGFGSETYVDAQKVGIADARNVINIGDNVPKVSNACKIAAAGMNIDPIRTSSANVTSMIVEVNGQKWVVVRSPANTATYDPVINKPLTEKQYNTVKNHHFFLKYYIPFVKLPGEQ